MKDWNAWNKDMKDYNTAELVHMIQLIANELKDRELQRIREITGEDN